MTAPRSDFYIYVLFRENGTPFYVGKGHNGRWLGHERAARSGAKGHRFAIIRKMQARGIEIPKIKLHEGLTEEVAFAYETALITAIGRGARGPLTNLTDGGDGASGFKHTPEAIAKMRGKKRSPEAREKMSAVRRGKELSPEHAASIGAAMLRRGPHTPEHRAKIGVAHRGKKHSPETMVKLLGRKYTPETIAKLRAASLGRNHTPEARKKMSAAQRGRKHMPEIIAKMRAAKLGRSHSPEARENMSAAKRGKKHTPETIAKMSAAHRRRRFDHLTWPSAAPPRSPDAMIVSS